MTRTIVRGIVVGLAGLGVMGQLAAGLLLVCGMLAVIGVRAPLAYVKRAVSGAEMWLAAGVAAFATGGSLFFSEVAHFPPCEVCIYQRICMYPLSVIIPAVAVFGGRRAARWLLPLPIAGTALSAYHVLLENGLAPQTTSCLLSSPGGCALKWINEFDYMTIPTLSLTAFVLIIALLLLAASDSRAAHVLT